MFAQGTFSKSFLGKISAILPICIMQKFNLEVSCKGNHFGYWNQCKGLPNFVNPYTVSPIKNNTPQENHLKIDQVQGEIFILALISIRIAVSTHCQMNENPCSNQKIRVLFEHGSELENT